MLGKANWCTVADNHLLIKETSDPNELRCYNTNAYNAVSLDKKSFRDKNTHLDPNHSHFILVDNSQLNAYGGEIEFRGKLESAISNYNTKLWEKSEPSPIVVLVLEGLDYRIIINLNC